MMARRKTVDVASNVPRGYWFEDFKNVSWVGGF